MRTTTFLLAILVAVPALAGASRIEDLTGIRYQHDADKAGDASDRCEAPFPPVEVGVGTEGLLLPIDDEEDNYGLEISRAEVGIPILVRVASAPGISQGIDTHRNLQFHRVAVFKPFDCVRHVGIGSEVRFVPMSAGTYDVKVTLAPTALLKDQAAADGDVAAQVPGPVPLECHPICHTTDGFHPYLGYLLTLETAT